MNIKSIRPIKDYVLVSDMNFGERQLSSGIVLMGDDKKSSGIRPRWAQVYAIGEEQKDVQVGQWVLIEHGRWTRGVKVEIDDQKLVLRRVDNNAIMLVTDEKPNSDDMLANETVV